MDHTYSTAAKEGEGACYTSLISSVCYPPREDSTYFTGILQKENGHSTISESAEELRTSLPGVPGMEPRGLFSSDSGIEMTPAESTEVNKILADPLDQMKAEAYKYIDISRPEKVKYQEVCHPKLEDKDLDFKNKDTEISTKSEEAREAEKPAPVEGKILKDHLFEESTFAPYIDDISEEQHRAPLITAPIKITLTEIEPSGETATPEKTPEKQDICLKPSPDTVPTVTVSEPEDDSPGSVTPPSSGTEPSAAESQGKCSISEDELITAIKEAKGLSYETKESPRPTGHVAERSEGKARSGLPTIPSPLDHEASSAESGDSEIELVSEDPMAAEDALPSGYVTFGHVGGPPPSPASPSIQYSILREEREAELDSELIIESCDASSASEVPSGDGAPIPEGPAAPWKPVEATSSDQSPAATKGPGPRGPGVAPPLLFLNKQKDWRLASKFFKINMLEEGNLEECNKMITCCVVAIGLDTWHHVRTNGSTRRAANLHSRVQGLPHPRARRQPRRRAALIRCRGDCGARDAPAPRRAHRLVQPQSVCSRGHREQCCSRGSDA
nr:reticulon-1-like [Vicugna pacos]